MSALLCVVEPAEFQHWLSIGELMREERREEAEETIQLIATAVQKQTGKVPILYIREGDVKDELLAVIEEEKKHHFSSSSAPPPGPTARAR